MKTLHQVDSCDSQVTSKALDDWWCKDARTQIKNLKLSENEKFMIFYIITLSLNYIDALDQFDWP